ncbi:LLM class flavin-dependent oxidoreductase [Rhodococcoides yunnanense]|uniref:LLM class flavin-dependent oxidoreductase n=1 Tax=Rhodococcoides yunnanense TaxID=278209 RepID=UPI0009354CD1|nr:LLM class flavin-dependent oxidoreductase [Rhodococcus yunnanensis]
MQFGNLFTQQTPDMSYSHADRLKETIELTKLAESLGYDSVSFAENHFSNYGYSPNPVLLAAAIGQHTERIRLGSAVAVLPFWNPIRLAEDVATADLLLGGRFELGIGRGYQHIEFNGLGLPYDERQDIYAEALEFLLGAWTSDEFTYEGKYFNVAKPINVLPKSFTKPHPKIMIGVASESSVRAAASTEFRVFGTSLAKVKKASDADNSAAKGDQEKTADEFFGESASHHEIYLAERKRLGLSGDHWVNGMNRQVYVTSARTGTKEYESELNDALVRSRLLTRMGYGLRTEIIDVNRGELVPLPQPGDPPLESYLEHLVFGTPEEVTAQFRELADAGVQEVNLMIDYAGIPFEKARSCMRLFGEEVIPAIKESESVAAQ